MSITNSPNMNLPIPGVGNEIGPDYASDNNNCFSIIDSHSHVPGSGVPITPSALNINADLTFLNNNAIGLRSVRLQDQNGTLSGGADLACIYNNGGNMYFNDGAGNQIAITAAGGIAGSPGSIANLTAPAAASYVSGSKSFLWQSNSNAGAAMDNGSVTIRETDVANAKGITLSSPTALGANYGLTLFTGLPASTQYVSVSASGVMSLNTADAIAAAMTVTGADAIASVMDATGANDIAATITSTGANTLRTTMTKTVGSTATVGNLAVSASTSSFVTLSGTFIDVGVSVTITTSGKPVRLYLMPDGVGTSLVQSSKIGSPNAGTWGFSFAFHRGSTVLPAIDVFNSAGTSSVNPSAWRYSCPPASIASLDTPSAGTYVYKIFVSNGNIGDALALTNCVLIAEEMV